MRITTGDGLSLEARLDEPVGEARGGVVLCHPHPSMGGTMNAPFLDVMADRLASSGLIVLRFNTRGTGTSDGAFSQGVGEVNDLDAAWADLLERLAGRPAGLVGWSFGARLAMVHAQESAVPTALFAPPVSAPPGWLPVLSWPSGPYIVVMGDRDRLIEIEAVEGHFGQAPIVLTGCDHFFIGRFGEIAADLAVEFFSTRL